MWFCFFFQAEDGIRDDLVTGVQTCALPISLESKTTKRPSALTACCEELLTPFAGPAALWDTLVVEAMQPATGPPEELQVSRIQTVLVKPPPGTGVCVLNTMNRPSSLIAGSWLFPRIGFPPPSTETIVVEGEQTVAPVQVSRTYMFCAANPPAGAPGRFVEADANATKRPSALIA